MQVLKAQNLAKKYGPRQVVADVTIEVKPGQIVGLLGPNGAGKTTCFYMIVGLVPCDSGKVILGDEDLTGMPMHHRARRGIGYLPQEASIFRKLSVEQNIKAILQLRNLTAAEERKELEHLLEDFQLTHIRHSAGMALSGGERRRVEIARALAAAPQFILLDEPFAGVDPISVNDIRKIIQQLRDRGLGVLITDHGVRETLSVCEHTYIVSNGHVIAEGDAETLMQNPQVRQVYLGDDFSL
ncbi:LPS export ABC transporter ATP-binding protein [Pelagibaculum spongiae]|uniref:Lipopolysaccharide export system ATP-binding protein LptB n=1 Tax=Pelagibaculum spongiae TaxID=2080658 RepID=A0A2V1GXM8_9GAMM|nr:LPS export ABC transporter ATP-binding protein [Pelagibaculum spongiae]PVZ71921.1 LPS export ABC transporter ATP-binding protein [Pelagibaculum spongiae]